MKTTFVFAFMLAAFAVQAEDKIRDSLGANAKTTTDTTVTVYDIGERFELSSNNGSERVSFEARREFSVPGLGLRFPNLTQTIVASAPLDKKSTDKRTELANLDGLADAFTLKFTISRIASESKPNDANLDGTKKGEFLSLITKKWDATGAGLRPTSVRPEEVTDDLMLYYASSEQLREWRTLSWSDAKPIFVQGVSATIGYEEYDYLRSVTLSETSAKRVPYSLKAYCAKRTASKRMVYSFGYEYQKAYKKGETKTLCVPDDSNPQLFDCEEKVVGGPVDDSNEIGFFEMRGYFSWNDNIKPFAASLKLSYDFEDDIAGIDVPIFLTRSKKKDNKEGKLNGGIRLGWRDDTDKITFGLFVGGDFKLFDDI